MPGIAFVYGGAHLPFLTKHHVLSDLVFQTSQVTNYRDGSVENLEKFPVQKQNLFTFPATPWIPVTLGRLGFAGC